MATLSLHVKLRDHIAGKIRAGDWQPGERLPGEHQLAREFKISRETVRKAYDLLAHEGLIEKRPKRGTFVAEQLYRDKIITAVLRSREMLERRHGQQWLNIQYMLEGFAGKAEASGVMTNIRFFDHERLPVDDGVRSIARDNVIGCVFPYPGPPLLLEALGKAGLACVSRTPFPDWVCNSVAGDLAEGVCEAVSYLIAGGRRRIAIFTELLPDDPTFEGSFAQARFMGFSSAMTDAGVSIVPELVRFCPNPEEAHEEARRMLNDNAEPDAIFAGTDSRAVQIMRVLKDAGIRVPEDVALVGSNNAPACLWQEPPLATVEYPLEKIGAAMFEALMEYLRNPAGGFVHTSVPCTFIRRKSCG